MSPAASDNLGTTPVRQGYEIDLDALAGWMEENVEGFAGPLQAEQFKGGQSNPTYRLTTPDRNYVLRRKPPGKLLKGAHAVDREARVMAGLGKAGFPVPRIYGLCEDESVIGTMFFVMEMVEGRIFWDAEVPGVEPEERAAIFDAMNVTLAALHTVDYEAVGLGDYGRPGNYIERQLARWTQQYRADELAGADPHMDRLIAWLEDNRPTDDEDRSSVIHGDIRIDNMIFHPGEPRVLAVLDWELSTLGHPSVDFAYNAMMYRMPPRIVAGLGGKDLSGTGIPSERDYLDAYCQRVGLPGMPNYDYYVAFNFFRLAAILHGIKGRYLRGTASSAQAKTYADAVPFLCEVAWQQTKHRTL